MQVTVVDLNGKSETIMAVDDVYVSDEGVLWVASGTETYCYVLRNLHGWLVVEDA